VASGRLCRAQRSAGHVVVRETGGQCGQWAAVPCEVVSVASGRLCRAQRWTCSGRRDRWSVWPVGGCAVHSAVLDM